jgi:hypothetical protein
MVMASLLLYVQKKVGARAHNDGIVVKMWKSGCQPIFFIQLLEQQLDQSLAFCFQHM